MPKNVVGDRHPATYNPNFPTLTTTSSTRPTQNTVKNMQSQHTKATKGQESSTFLLDTIQRDPEPIVIEPTDSPPAIPLQTKQTDMQSISAPDLSVEPTETVKSDPCETPSAASQLNMSSQIDPIVIEPSLPEDATEEPIHSKEQKESDPSEVNQRTGNGYPSKEKGDNLPTSQSVQDKHECDAPSHEQSVRAVSPEECTYGNQEKKSIEAENVNTSNVLIDNIYKGKNRPQSTPSVETRPLPIKKQTAMERRGSDSAILGEHVRGNIHKITLMTINQSNTLSFSKATEEPTHCPGDSSEMPGPSNMKDTDIPPAKSLETTTIPASEGKVLAPSRDTEMSAGKGQMGNYVSGSGSELGKEQLDKNQVIQQEHLKDAKSIPFSPEKEEGNADTAQILSPTDKVTKFDDKCKMGDPIKAVDNTTNRNHMPPSHPPPMPGRISEQKTPVEENIPLSKDIQHDETRHDSVVSEENSGPSTVHGQQSTINGIGNKDTKLDANVGQVINKKEDSSSKGYKPPNEAIKTSGPKDSPPPLKNFQDAFLQSMMNNKVSDGKRVRATNYAITPSEKQVDEFQDEYSDDKSYEVVENIHSTSDGDDDSLKHLKEADIETISDQSPVSVPCSESTDGCNVIQHNESTENNMEVSETAPSVPSPVNIKSNVQEFPLQQETLDSEIEQKSLEEPLLDTVMTSDPTDLVQDKDEISIKLMQDKDKIDETEATEANKDREQTHERDASTDILLEAQRASGIVPEDFKDGSGEQDSPVDPAKNPEIVKCITYSPEPKEMDSTPEKDSTSDVQVSTVAEVASSGQFDESEPIIVEITREETSSVQSNESGSSRSKESSGNQSMKGTNSGTKRPADHSSSANPQIPSTTGYMRTPAASINKPYPSTSGRHASLEQYKEAVYRKDTQGIMSASQKIQQEIEEAISIKRARMDYPPRYPYPQQQVEKSHMAHQPEIMVAGEPERFKRMVLEGKPQLITQHQQGLYQDPRMIPGPGSVQLNYSQQEHVSNERQDQMHHHQRSHYPMTQNSGYNHVSGFSNRPGQGQTQMYQTPSHFQNKSTSVSMMQPTTFHESQSASRFPYQQTVTHSDPTGMGSRNFSQLQTPSYSSMNPYSNIARNPNPTQMSPSGSQSNTYPQAPPSYQGNMPPNKMHLDALQQHRQQELVKSSAYPNVNIAEVGLGHAPQNRIPPVTYNRYPNPQAFSHGQHSHLQQQQTPSAHQPRMPYPIHQGNQSAISMQQNIQYQQQIHEQQQRSKMMSAAEKQMYDINRLYPDKQQQQVNIVFFSSLAHGCFRTLSKQCPKFRV